MFHLKDSCFRLRGGVLLGLMLVVGCEDNTLQPASLSTPRSTQQEAAAAAGRSDVIVLLEPRENPENVARAHGVQPRHVYTQVLNGFAGSISEAARAGLMRDSRIVAVVPDERVESTTEVTPAASWGLDRVDQRPLPLSGTYAYNTAGQGVTVYVIDSGIRFDHTEFEGRAVRGFDAIGDGQNGADCSGHGTHVAGTIGGATYGIARAVRLVSVRVLPCSGSGTVSGLIAGIEWVARNHVGPAIANISIGAAKNTTLNNAVRNLIAAGVTTTVSAANDNADACQKSPGSTPEALTIGATAANDSRASYSNYGSCIDLFAPGSSIRSASHGSATGSTTKSGTSMAAPHVAGVAALILAANPGSTPAEIGAKIAEMASKNVVSDSRSANAHLLYSLLGTATSGPTPEPDPEPTPEPTPEPSPPTAPDNLSGTAVVSVSLSWRDRSSDESGFEVYRKTGSSSYSLLTRVGANVNSFTDAAVNVGQTYSYRVSAYNAAGSSALSNELTLTVTCVTKGKSSNCR